MKKLLIIDGHGLLFQSFFGMPKRIKNSKGENIEAAKYFQQAMDVNTITNEIDPADIQDRLNSLFD